MIKVKISLIFLKLHGAGINHEKDAIKPFMFDIDTQKEVELHGFRQCRSFVNLGIPTLLALLMVSSNASAAVPQLLR